MKRLSWKSAIDQALLRNPICYLAGPRQVGKTTLAREFLPHDHPAYFDLEDPASLSRLENPKLALTQETPLTVIDEIQRRPDLFTLLRVLADEPVRATRWLILGSASPSILKGVSESLAGRVEMVHLSGFSLEEVGIPEHHTLWLRGGFPRSFLAASDPDSSAWRKHFINLVTERDIPALGVQLPPPMLLRLWNMMAHWHGQIWNSAEPARSLGISESTIRRLTEFFEGLYLIRLLRPWHANISKRQVKSPKLYIRDCGLCNTLLGIADRGTLVSHPKSGSVWEGLIIEELITRYRPDETWFWATHNGAELDLLLVKNSMKIGFEIKLAPAPKVTPSMRTALQDLHLDHLYIVHSGKHSWSLGERITAVSLDTLPSSLAADMDQ